MKDLLEDGHKSGKYSAILSNLREGGLLTSEEVNVLINDYFSKRTIVLDSISECKARIVSEALIDKFNHQNPNQSIKITVDFVSIEPKLQIPADFNIIQEYTRTLTGILVGLYEKYGILPIIGDAIKTELYDIDDNFACRVEERHFSITDDSAGQEVHYVLLRNDLL